MIRTLAALALTGALATCAPTGRPPTVSISACTTTSGTPLVNWYVVGRGHEIWIHSGTAPMMIANASAPRARAGTIPGAWNTDGRTVAVQITIDDTSDTRTVWATSRCRS